MDPVFLDLLRCPVCGSRFDFRPVGDPAIHGVLSCPAWCNDHPFVDGVAYVRTDTAAAGALGHLADGHPEEALRLLLGLDPAAASGIGSWSMRDAVSLLRGRNDEGYFLYRSSDPTFLGVEWLTTSVVAAGPADTPVLDLAGGVGHLARSLTGLRDGPVLLADGLFANVWLARRYVAPRAFHVCCDADLPLPFPAGVFSAAICADAFHYVWYRRRLAWDLAHLVQDDGVVLLPHSHNALPEDEFGSAGMPLAPSAYRALFPGMTTRLFPDRQLTAAALARTPVDLSEDPIDEDIVDDPALAVVAARTPHAFRRYPVPERRPPQGRLVVNPLYGARPSGDGLLLVLREQPAAYEAEFGGYRDYLPPRVELAPDVAAALDAGGLDDELLRLFELRVLLDIPLG